MTSRRSSCATTGRTAPRDLAGFQDDAAPAPTVDRPRGARTRRGASDRRSPVPAVGHSFGKLNIPKGVSHLLGGADYGTITGWYRSEIGAIYGPLVISAMAITGVVSATAGEEEDRILTLVLAHPIKRSRLIAAKAGAIAVVVCLIAVAAWLGLIAGVALGGGGISLGDLSAYSLHLAFFGLAIGAIALAVGAGTGRRALATGVAAAVGAIGWLINGFAPLVNAIAWLRYLSPFYYYAGHDPLTEGVGTVHLAVLGLLALAFTTVAVASNAGTCGRRKAEPSCPIAELGSAALASQASAGRRVLSHSVRSPGAGPLLLSGRACAARRATPGFVGCRYEPMEPTTIETVRSARSPELTTRRSIAPCYAAPPFSAMDGHGNREQSPQPTGRRRPRAVALTHAEQVH